MIMTENDIRNEWESHLKDTFPKEKLDAAFIKVMSAADRREKAQEKTMCTTRGNKMRRMALTFTAAAAALVFIPMATLKISGMLHGDRLEETVAGETPRMCEVTTHNGETGELTLPDGSHVKMNAGSTIIYPEKFSSTERNVYLSGEAIFEVTHNQDVPFTVSTSDFTVLVHGTTFNVNAYPESGSTSATLCEGSISATLKSTGKNIDLTPDERMSYDRTTGVAKVSHVNAAEDTAWERGDMCFRSVSIHDIARAIERKYGINTYITSGKYDGMILTAKFVHGETLEQMLGAICKLVPGMRYRIENNSVYIR